MGFVQATQFMNQAEVIRHDHPSMGCRKIALMLLQHGAGRDRIEAFLLQGGFRVQYPPNFTKTTHSLRHSIFKNLIEGLKLNGINQVVQTDITYLRVKDKFYYLVFIIDIYSRRITGHHASNSLEAKGNLAALEKMISLRGKAAVMDLIHHSDKGTQYHSKKYLDMLTRHQIKVSMCLEAWENAYTERINLTIKDEYLKHYTIENLTDLTRGLDRAVDLYNTTRPHWSLPKQMSPIQFEQYISKLTVEQRPVMTVYKPQVAADTAAGNP